MTGPQRIRRLSSSGRQTPSWNPLRTSRGYPGPAENGPYFLEVGQRAERELDLGGLVAADQADALAAAKGTASPADLVPPHPGRVGAQADVPAVQHHSLGRSNLYRSGPDKKAGPAAESPTPVDPVPAWMHALANQDSTLIDHRPVLDPSIQLAVPALAHPGADQDIRQKRGHEDAEDRTSGHCRSPVPLSVAQARRDELVASRVVNELDAAITDCSRRTRVMEVERVTDRRIPGVMMPTMTVPRPVLASAASTRKWKTCSFTVPYLHVRASPARMSPGLRSRPERRIRRGPPTRRQLRSVSGAAADMVLTPQTRHRPGPVRVTVMLIERYRSVLTERCLKIAR